MKYIAIINTDEPFTEDAIQYIKNTPELVDFLLDKSVIADSREKLHKRLEEVCNLAIKALEQEPCEDCISRQAVKELYYKDGYIDFRKICELPPVNPQPNTDVLEKQMSGSENSLHKVKDTLKGVIDAMTIYSQWDEGYVAGIESAVDTINRYLGEEE